MTKIIVETKERTGAVPIKKLPSVFVLSKQTVALLARNWKTFGTFILLYGILSVVFVQGGTAFTNMSASKELFDASAEGVGQFASGIGLFTYLLSAAGGASGPTSVVYQFILLIIFSLASIWVIRHLYGKQAVSARDGLYYGMTPLIPFVLVLGLLCVQLLPLAVGALLYNIVGSYGLIASGVEQLLWIVIFVALASVSFYFISSSLFALYIVTLPDMTPMQALRAARQLVRRRRWTVVRKLLFLPFALLAVGCVLVVPFILFVTPVAAAVFFVFTLLCLPLFHGYMYHLYRALV